MLGVNRVAMAGFLVGCAVYMCTAETNSNVCWVERALQRFLEGARYSLMESWGLLDMMRRITIDQKSKSVFMVKIAPELVKMTSSLASAAGVCSVFPEVCRACHQDFVDLSDRLHDMSEAFAVLTISHPQHEELVLASVLDEARAALGCCLTCRSSF